MSDTPTPFAETGMDPATLHTPVLLERCCELLAPGIDAALSAGRTPVVIDATLGMGGHSEGLLSRFPHLVVVGIDRDPQALSLATRRLAPFAERFRTEHATYDAIDVIAPAHSTIREGQDAGCVDGVLMDLGVSSLQLDDQSRGFSYARPAPLDMRMDTSSSTTAADILEQSSVSELSFILRTYGEERFASRIAQEIVRRREAGTPVQTTAELAELVRDCIPAPARRTGGNPAKRTFQALRIAVNDELDVLTRAIPHAINALCVGGRLVVESYQSLEDRIVKTAITAGTTINAPSDLPIIPQEAAPYLRAVTHGAERASDQDIAENPRSAPVRLRAAERIRPASEAPAEQPRRRRSAGASPSRGTTGRAASSRRDRHSTTHRQSTGRRRR